MAARAFIQFCLVIVLLTIDISAASRFKKRIEERVKVLEVRFDAETRFRREDMSNLMDKMESVSAMFNLSAEHVTCQQQKGINNKTPSDSSPMREVSKLWRRDLMQITKALKEEKMLNVKIRGQFSNIVDKTRNAEEAMNRVDKTLDNVSNNINTVATDTKTVLYETTANQIKLTELVHDTTELKQELSRVNVTLDNVSEDMKTIVTDVKTVSNDTAANQIKLMELVHEMAELKQELLNVKEKCISNVKEKITSNDKEKSTSNDGHPRSCKELYEIGRRVSGVYDVYPDGTPEPIRVFCDQETDGGGWTVFQRREDGSEDFYRGWVDYKNGFGESDGEFWLGNKYLSILTSTCCHQLRIDLGDFKEEKKYAIYDDFQIGSKDEKYSLKIGGYSGNANDSLSYHNGMRFTTKDQDNDARFANNCAVNYIGAWWYNDCHFSNLNGQYQDNTYSKGVNWYHWHGYQYSLKFTEMKFR